LQELGLKDVNRTIWQGLYTVIVTDQGGSPARIESAGKFVY
jgi:hypothetical protein